MYNPARARPSPVGDKNKKRPPSPSQGPWRPTQSQKMKRRNGMRSGPALRNEDDGVALRVVFFRRRRDSGRHPLQGPREVPLDAGIGPIGVAPKEDHDRKHVGPTYKKVYQGVLMHPVDLSKEAADAVALDAALGPAPRRKADLEGHVVAHGFAVHPPEEEADAADGLGAHIVPAAVKQSPDQPPALEPVRLRESVPPVRTVLVGSIRHERRAPLGTRAFTQALRRFGPRRRVRSPPLSPSSFHPRGSASIRTGGAAEPPVARQGDIS